MYWLTDSRRVCVNNGYSDVRYLSTPEVEYQFSKYSKVNDAIGFTYEIEGNNFYVLAFPSEDKTWVLNVDTEFWHEWSSAKASGVTRTDAVAPSITQPVNITGATVANVDCATGSYALTYTSTDDWYINGVKFTGTVLTVGAGKDFTKIQAALDSIPVDGGGAPPAIPNEYLILVDAGNYAADGWFYYTNRYSNVYIRGLGASCTDTIADYFLSIGDYGKVSFENITIPQFINAKGFISKVYTNILDQIQESQYVRYTTISPKPPSYGYVWPHLRSCNLSVMSLDKVAYVPITPDWYEESCSGTLALDDKAHYGTEGYGHEYGSMYITEVVSRTLKLGSGVEVEVTESGTYAVTDTSGNTLNVTVVYSSLPSSSTSDTITVVVGRDATITVNRRPDGFGRHRGNCSAKYRDKWIVGDFQNGLLYQLSMDTFTDYYQPIKRQRAGQVINKDRIKVSHHSFEIDMEVGAGLDALVQGSEPIGLLDWSDDGGHTWSNYHKMSLGKIGEFTRRVKWNRLGMSRNRVYRFTISDPIKIVIFGAYADLEGSAS
jgi:hypothetical protein